jgi:hypothetical protein
MEEKAVAYKDGERAIETRRKKSEDVANNESLRR